MVCVDIEVQSVWTDSKLGTSLKPVRLMLLYYNQYA
jgi:hypothetical protein